MTIFNLRCSCPQVNYHVIRVFTVLVDTMTSPSLQNKSKLLLFDRKKQSINNILLYSTENITDRSFFLVNLQLFLTPTGFLKQLLDLLWKMFPLRQLKMLSEEIIFIRRGYS